ncbi:MAG: hypothetical protein NTW96_26750 [Planctomycetia bacterium]|nr:hypothetical protein [Planctomycetia bacterium]
MKRLALFLVAILLAVVLRAGPPSPPNRWFIIDGQPHHLVVKSWREVYRIYNEAPVVVPAEVVQ